MPLPILRSLVPGLSRVLAWCACWVGCMAAQAAPPVQRVDLPLPSGTVLRLHWAGGPSDALQSGQVGQGPELRPAVMALHGCGGLYARSGALSARYREAFERLQAAGYAVLMPDSFGSRGLRDVCQTRYSERTVQVSDRVQDARAALAWLAMQPGVDARRIAVLGWSHGGTTALNLLEQRHAKPQAGEPALAGVAVYYPGCGPLLRRQAAIGTVPLLLQLGALDDWTPPQPCVDWVRLLQTRPDSDVTVHVYDDSYHGFDGTAAVRWRSDVPNGTTGQGVHQGGHPVARVQSLAALESFWQRVLAPVVRPAATAPF